MNIVSISFYCMILCCLEPIYLNPEIGTMFTKGQPRRRHLLQCFGSKHSLLSKSPLICLQPKNFKPDAAWTDEKCRL